MKVIDQDMLESFRRECASALRIKDYNNESISQEILITLLYAYYHYYDANPDCVEQLKAGGLIYDSTSTHCISGIYKSADVKNGIDILITLGGDKTVNATSLGKSVYNIFKNCIAFLNSIRGDLFGGVPSAAEQRLLDLGYTRYGDETVPVKILFLLGFSPTDKQKETIEKELKSTLSLDDDALFADEIEYEIRNTNSTLKYVPQGSLRLDFAKNLCRHQNALMCNVKATSLRSLYQTYAYRGLLSQNLRYFVKMPRVDDAMMATMTMEPEKFWYLNNGIIIACKSYKVDGDILSLEDFSIINGGQTTHNIGVLTDDQLTMDFDIPCKVIPLPTTLPENKRLDFLAEISEASNTQKPINAVDAVANRREQRKLKEWLSEDKNLAIFYQTKRGEGIDKTVYKEAWQKITVAEFGQSIIAFLYQFPGIARTQKTRLFSDDILYYQLFSEPFPAVAFIKDLRILRTIIRAYATNLRLNSATNKTTKERLATNGEFFLLAIIGVLYKTYVNKSLAEQLSPNDSIENKLLLGKADIAMPFLNPNDAPHYKSLISLLDYCIDNFIIPGYRNYINGKASNDYSNFSKLETNYQRYVLDNVTKKILTGFTEIERVLLNATFVVPSTEVKAYACIYEKKHPSKWNPIKTFQETVLLQKMLEYINSLPKVRGVKKPTKSTLKMIINKRITKLADLAKVAAFSTDQIKYYGKGLLQLVKDHIASSDDEMAPSDDE